MELRHETARKAIHLGLFVLPAAAWILSRDHLRIVQVILVLLAVLALVVDLVRRRPGLLRTLADRTVGPLIRPTEENRFLGSTLYIVATALSFLMFPRTTALTALGFLVVGDSAAALVGRSFGRRQIRPGKTLEGTVGCLAGCLLVAWLVPMLDPAARLPILLLGALTATAAELLTSGHHDNLVMPLLSGAVIVFTARSC